MTNRATWLRMLAIWAIIWPLVTLGLFVLQAAAPSLPMAARTFVLTLLVVPSISLVIAPFVARRIPLNRD